MHDAVPRLTPCCAQCHAMVHATLHQMLDMQHAAQPVCMLITSKSNEILHTCQSPLLGIAWDPCRPCVQSHACVPRMQLFSHAD